MPKVIVLPDHIASQIAAGEVVERPSSVVKELVENSIDAGATKIVVSLEKGLRTIRVADNGYGMAPEDLTLAFQRHATSKLKSADDLWNLLTLGFRGEALPSIAAISRVVCYTRTASSDTGTRLESVDGALKLEEAGCTKGTIVEVYDLFFNVPARLNFLKKASTEFAHVYETMQGLAIAHIDIEFELHLDGILKFATTGSGDLARAIKESGLFSGQESLILIGANDGQSGFAVKGCVAGAKHFRGDRKGIISIVNGRTVRCPITYKALDYAYADLIPRGRYPLAVTIFSVNPKEIDVNIHPSKKEIKYSSGNEVYFFLQRAFTHALRQSGISEITTPAPSLPSNGTTYDSEPASPIPAVSEADITPIPGHFRSKDVFARQGSLFKDDLHTVPRPAITSTGVMGSTPGSQQEAWIAKRVLPIDWRIVGYLHNTYILLETAEGFSIVEQHIAHERVLYEQFLQKSETKNQQYDHLQRLIVVCPLHLTEEQKAFLSEHLSDLSELGFEFEAVGDSYSCVQLPVELAHKDYPRVVQEILQNLLENVLSDFKLEAVKSIACQSAVKNGKPLSEPQILDLLIDWYHTPRNETCPHGRPIQLSFSMDKLFQMFHPA
jgi:DNA mismatch repair protein MutL